MRVVFVLTAGSVSNNRGVVGDDTKDLFVIRGGRAGDGSFVIRPCHSGPRAGIYFWIPDWIGDDIGSLGGACPERSRRARDDRLTYTYYLSCSNSCVLGWKVFGIICSGGVEGCFTVNIAVCPNPKNRCCV